MTTLDEYLPPAMRTPEVKALSLKFMETVSGDTSPGIGLLASVRFLFAVILTADGKARRASMARLVASALEDLAALIEAQ